MENIHGETYSLLIDTYINDEKEKHHLLNGISTIKEIERKAEWAQKWINGTDSFDTRLIAFSVVEFHMVYFDKLYELNLCEILTCYF